MKNAKSKAGRYCRSKESYKLVLSEFYAEFKRLLDGAEVALSETGKVQVPQEELDVVCPNCGKKMIVKSGRFGKFAACPNYPECKSTKPLTAQKSEDDEEKKQKIAPFKCELCGSDMVYRTGRFGGFYACIKYPECKFTKQKVRSLGVSCPKCGKDVVTKHGRNKTVFYSCSGYPECDFSSWDMPTTEICPKCGGMLFVKKGKNQLVCKAEGCDYKIARPETVIETVDDTEE